ncbi:MAG: DUF4249 family protein [Candidatus Eisenbacteria bacterium]|uniref:DUF4249 family protein n=1 Tax=Eiseniibacteriota bacterium TaxID=2212470 RepID=A0A7Y2H2H1_UNCEI|nr:DUF4249 family protein [Candidatus Eisenbacteria bacterium]
MSLLPALVSCSAERDPSELLAPQGEPVIVVDATLLVGKQLPPVYVTRSLDPGEPFSASAAAVTDAVVTIMSASGATFEYVASTTDPGKYTPVLAGTTVQEETEYRLEVVVGDKTVRAVTTTPPVFVVDQWLWLDDTATTVLGQLKTFEEIGNEVYNVPENRFTHSIGTLEAWFESLEGVPGYQVGVFSLDLDSDFAVDVSFLDEEDQQEIKEEERNGTSPPLLGEDGKLRLPWFALLFEGRYRLEIYALDNNWFDLVRSVPELGGTNDGFGGNAGDDFESPLFHVEGGIGLFGSAAVHSMGLVIDAPEDLDNE